MYRRPGEHVVWRSRPQGQVGYVMPTTVVEDGPEVTVLFQPMGSVCKKRSGRRGGPDARSMLPGGWDGSYEDRVWTGPSMLKLYRPGTAHTVLRSWRFESDRAEGWYVNLEAPWRRTSIGFDSEDHVLDVTVAADLSSWEWKDADELEWSVDVGKRSRVQADEAWEEGRRAIRALEGREWPFVDDWSRWRPSADWPVPGLPDGWDDPRL
jgi:hypothetical protein